MSYELVYYPRGQCVGIKCHGCGRTSYNYNDVKARYCGCCHIFHPEPLYTHQDEHGLLWRFAGGRRVSEIADRVMRECGIEDTRGESEDHTCA